MIFEAIILIVTNVIDFNRIHVYYSIIHSNFILVTYHNQNQLFYRLIRI